jgi:hypothetical protein
MTNELTIGRMRSLLLVPVVALVIAGCGSGSSASFKTPEDVLAKIPGCTNIQPDTGPQFMNRESADCDFGGTADDPVSLTAVTFTDSGQQKQWMDLANKIGGGGLYVVGDKWLVQTDTSDQAHKVQQAVGGTVH